MDEIRISDQGDQIPHKDIDDVVIVLGGYTLLRLFNTDGLFISIIQNLLKSPADLVFYSATFLVPLPALYLFWRLQESGYLFSMFCVSYCLASHLLLISTELTATGNTSAFSKMLLLTPVAVYGYLFYLLFRSSMYRTFALGRMQVAVSAVVGFSLPVIF